MLKTLKSVVFAGSSIIVAGSCLFMLWVVRPLIIPRHGVWINHNYWINGVSCGKISNLTYVENGWGSLSDPPFWVGLPTYNHYQTEEVAAAAVEEACK